MDKSIPACLVLVAATVCCNGKSDVTEYMYADIPIEFSASSALTKSIAPAGPMPSSYTLFVSSHNNYLRNGNTLFTSRQFHSDGTVWASSPRSFWPVQGTLDFLALASEKDCLDVTASSEWSEDNPTLGVRVHVPDHAIDQSELMFASLANGSAESGRDMKFAHSQCWLRFDIRSNVSNLVRIDSIVLKEVYTGGTFIVDNSPPARDACWNFNGHTGTDTTVPGSEGLVVTEEGGAVNMLVPEQEECDIRIHYTVRGSSDEGWDENSKVGQYRLEAAPGNMWWYGIKRIYRISMNYSEVQISLSLTDWTYYDIEADLPD